MDVTVNNRLAVVNIKLLRDYAAIDSRLRPLVLLVKHWCGAAAAAPPPRSLRAKR